MTITKSMLIAVTFIITSSAYAANFSGVYKIIEGSCVEDNRGYKELGKKVSSLHVLSLLDSSARPLGLNEASLYEGEELTIVHSADSLRLMLTDVPHDFVTMNFEDSWGLFESVSVSDSRGEVLVTVREIGLLVQRYGKMAIRKSGNDIEIETTFQFNAMLGGTVDHTAKCRLSIADPSPRFPSPAQ